MIKLNTLHVGCHVLVGNTYEHFSVPKHIAEVTLVGSGYIECRMTPEQTDPDKYKENDIDGIPLEMIEPLLEKNGFFQSKLSTGRYIKDFDITHYRIVVNMSGTCSCNGEDLVDRTGLKYLHQLETCIAEAGIDFNFQF